MEQASSEEPAGDVVEATLEAEFGVYRLATEAPPPVPAFEEAAARIVTPPAGHSVDDWIEQATSHRAGETAAETPPEETPEPPSHAGPQEDVWG